MTSLNLRLRPLQRRLVQPHTVRELRLEQVVIAARHLGQRLGQLRPLSVRKVHEGAFVPARQDHHFEGPGRPPGTHGEEGGVGEDDAFLLLGLQLRVVDEEVEPALLAPVFLQLLQLQPGLLGHPRRRPYLPVRMRVRAPHRCALVLEDLHVPVLRVGFRDAVGLMAFGGEGRRGGDAREGRVGRQVRGVDLCPGVDDGQDLRGGEVGQGEVVRRGEGYHVAFAGDGFRAEEAGRETCGGNLEGAEHLDGVD